MKKIVSLLLVCAFLIPTAASAESEFLTIAGKRAKVVGKAAVYGLGGGLVVGVASQVFKKRAKNVFLFGSLGMYAGILLGIYVVSTSRGPTPYEGPDTYEDYGDFSGILRPEVPSVLAAKENGSPFRQAAVSMNFLNFEF